MTDFETRPEDVGQILVKVQEDLRQLREQFVGGEGQISFRDFQNALAKTEEGLQKKTEEVVHHMHTRVQTIPLKDPVRRDQDLVVMENTVDLHRTADFIRSGQLMRKPHPPEARLRNAQDKQAQRKRLSPGQKHNQQWTLRAIFNPHNEYNRSLLKDSFNIQLPLINQRQHRAHKPAGKPLVGPTVEHLTVLPRANRIDPHLAPPPISEFDAQKGILSLIERGLIPSAAKLTLDPAPVLPQGAAMHDQEEKHRREASRSPPGQLYGHLMLEDGRRQPEGRASSHSRHSRSSTAKSSLTTLSKTSATLKTFEMPLQPMTLPPIQPPPTTPASVTELKAAVSHRFAIQYGKVRSLQTEFLAFKQNYCLTWGSIVTMIERLENLMTSYSVPLAFIDGDRLADLSVEFELEKSPSQNHLLSVVVNRDEVAALIEKPGRLFSGPNGVDMAATRIQAAWRRYRDRAQYLDYRQLKWAAGVIALSWIMHIKMARMKKQLKVTRARHLENFRDRAKKFAASWDRIKKSPRVVIHMSSLGLSHNVRNGMLHFNVRQNSQMARLCDIQDPNVDVIFVSAVPLSDETLQYYVKLLALSAAVESGKVEDQSDVSDRYKILVPEAVQSFPTHSLCLSTLLKYSPVALKRMANLIAGREAYIVTRVPHVDDLAIAEYLDVPILAPEPDVAALYSTKSGAKRILAAAGIEFPPSEYDVYSLEQLHDCLAQLVVENLAVQRWLFKLDNSFDGHGIAYCDVPQHLKCYKWALREARRYGDKWSKKWAQEAAYIKVHSEIPDILDKYAQPNDDKTYSDWQMFIASFLSQGGVIEACPPTESLTSLTADFLIAPNGQQSLLSTGDQIHANSPFQNWGVSVPQSSVEGSTITAMCRHIGEACKSRGIVGYVQVYFVTFIHPTLLHQVVWAVDLRLHYSDALAMFQLARYITRGKFSQKRNTFNVLLPPPPPKGRPAHSGSKEQLAGEEKKVLCPRYCVLTTNMFHTNLAVVHYSVFFQMCRAHGIGYDIKEKQGSMFTLIDSFNRDKMGMITVGDNLQGALATFARNLSVIHQEISAPNMQGISNFKEAIADIEGILSTTVHNAEQYESMEQEEEDD